MQDSRMVDALYRKKGSGKYITHNPTLNTDPLRSYRACNTQLKPALVYMCVYVCQQPVCVCIEFESNRKIMTIFIFRSSPMFKDDPVYPCHNPVIAYGINSNNNQCPMMSDCNVTMISQF